MNRTLQGIKNSTSLDNLKKAKPAGQIATLLILIITAVLIFVLIVANIGQVSNYATNLSNAADSASLYFASQIGTKSYQLSQSLMRSCHRAIQCCVKRGLLSVVLSIIVAIVAIVVAGPLGGLAALGFTAGGAGALVVGTGLASALGLGLTTGGLIVAGAIGGMIGGAIGGAIVGTGALQGTIQGALIGVGIGGGISGGASLLGGGQAAGSGGTLANVAPGLAAGGDLPATVGIAAGASMPATTTGIVSGITTFTSVTGAAIGASLGANLSAASNIYNAYVKDAMAGDAMAAAVKALNGLPETQRIRESIFLQALSETIDDPNKVQDSYDSDGDGNTAELVPSFQFCWDRRIVRLKEGNLQSFSQQQTAVKQFLRDANSPVQKFLDAINQFLPYLNRMEVEGNGIEGSDGSLILLFRTLENKDYPVSFWEPGPSAAELAAWKDWDPNVCPNCEPPNPPAGYDEVDYALDEVSSDFMDEIEAIREQTDDHLVYNWKQWVSWFYEPQTNEAEGTPDDYYNSLYRLINGDSSSEPVRIGLNGWMNEIERIRQGLPACIYGSNQYDGEGNVLGCFNYINSTDCIKNPACRWHPSNPNFATIDDDFEDEFQAARNIINNFIQSAQEFRVACAQFYETMESLEALGEFGTSSCGLSGTNPITYTWDDSGGNHSIQVGLSSYNMPVIVKRKHGNWLKRKICMELRNYEQNLRVDIERQDPAQVEVGVLGRWNPSQGGIIQRRAIARYRGLAGDNNGYVKIVGR